MAGCCEHANELRGSAKFVNILTRWRPVSFWRRILPHGVSSL